MGLSVAIAAALLAFTAITFMVRAAAAVEAAEARAAAGDAAREEAARLAARVRALRREVDVLSAIREVALIANDDVSFERILGEVLKIVEDLVEARVLAIFLREENGGALAARAVREGGETRFSGAGAGASGLDAGDLPSLAGEAFAMRRTILREGAGEVEVAALLYADAEVGGVLAARVPLSSAPVDVVDGAAEAGAPSAGDIAATLEALAKHVALAIEKPTLYDKAVVDALTRLHTRRHFTAELARSVAEARRAGRPFALVLADVDHFKRVNDTHGHVTGDLVLAGVAATVAATIRESDAAFRYGGEEIVVLAPDTDAAAGRALAERLRAAIEARDLRTAAGAPLRVTASFGIAAFGPAGAPPGAAPIAEGAALLDAADKALYAAKDAGRNRVRAHGDADVVARSGGAGAKHRGGAEARKRGKPARAG